MNTSRKVHILPPGKRTAMQRNANSLPISYIREYLGRDPDLPISQIAIAPVPALKF